MKKKTIEVFHLFGNTSLSRMSDDLIYIIMDNVTFKQVENSIVREIDDYKKIVLHSPENSDTFVTFSKAIERDKKLLFELRDHFEWIER